MSKNLIDYRIEKLLVGLEGASTKLQDHENRINHIENNMICDSRKRFNIKRRAESHVSKVLGGKESPRYKTDYRSTIRQLWMDYWNTFGITTYHDTPALMYETAIQFIDDWVPQAMKGIEEPQKQSATA